LACTFQQVILGTIIATTVSAAQIAEAQGQLASPATCKGNHELVAPCFTVHGRLFAANGTPTFRIWPVGTKRLYGVSGAEDRGSLPECLAPHIGFDKQLYADFVVCPFTHDRAGWMRFVCVESARNMTVHDSAGLAAARSPRVYKVAGSCTAP